MVTMTTKMKSMMISRQPFPDSHVASNNSSNVDRRQLTSQLSSSSFVSESSTSDAEEENINSNVSDDVRQAARDLLDKLAKMEEKTSSSNQGIGAVNSV